MSCTATTVLGFASFLVQVGWGDLRKRKMNRLSGEHLWDLNPASALLLRLAVQCRQQFLRLQGKCALGVYMAELCRVRLSGQERKLVAARFKAIIK
jgi:hypothetical protein